MRILEKLNLIFSNKYFLQIYFILFIILNILDFLNKLSADIDFFKKILSWSIIGFIFYKASPSKICIGIKKKTYDLLFILGFSFMGIVKSLAFYVSPGIYVEKNYKIFNYFLTSLSNLDLNLLVNISFILGLVLIIILSISLLKNNSVKKKSFLGSFNFPEFFLFIKFNYFILILFNIFFGLVIFNLFMEWFALAIDSVILVLGLIYYIFSYFKKHFKDRFSNNLRIISTTGEEFYEKLILMFSNKKTIFMGISLLLTIHLLVDIGVFMVPYSIGTQNLLYFNSLGISNHLPLFNFLDLKNSQIYNDLINTSSFLLLFTIILIYFSSLFFVVSSLFLPFYIISKNIQNSKINLNNNFKIFYIITGLFFLMISLLPNLTTPISIGLPQVKSISGVDISTHSIFNLKNSINSTNYTQSELLISIILFLLLIIVILIEYNKFKFFFDKSIYIFVLLFFIFYIFTFYISIISNDFNSLFVNSKNNFENMNSSNFGVINKIYQNKSYYSEKSPKIIKINNNTKISFYPFSNLSLKNLSLSLNHKDYIFVNITNLAPIKIYFSNYTKIFLPKRFLNSNKYFSNGNYNFIYYLGTNYFDILKVKRGFSLRNNLNEKNLKKIISFKNKDKNLSSNTDILKSLFSNFLKYLRLFFLSFFYIFGVLFFIFHYSKTNIFK